MNFIPGYTEKEYKINEIRSIVESEYYFFDEATINVLDNLIKEIESTSEEGSYLQNKVSNYLEENNGIPTREDLEIYSKLDDLAVDYFLAKERINALSEMKVIYLYKTVEINIKLIISKVSPGYNTEKLYKWNEISKYFTKRGIDLKILSGNDDLEGLRNVNNAIKHSGKIENKIKDIAEFENANIFEFKNITQFVERVKPNIKVFLKELVENIIFNLNDEGNLEPSTFHPEF